MFLKCRYDCGFEGEMAPYIGFFPQQDISEAHERDSHFPKYGCHLGVDCPKCGRWQKWIKQTSENMLVGKFYFVADEDVLKNQPKLF